MTNDAFNDTTPKPPATGTKTMTATAVDAPDFDAIKARQRATWASGDFGIIGTTLQIVGETLCEAVDLRAGSTVLDVAAGNGNCSLAAARRWCRRHLHRLRPGAARGRPPPRRGRAAGHRVPGGRRRGAAVRRRHVRRRAVVVRRDVRAEPCARGRPSCCASAAPAAASASPTGRRAASSASCSRSSAVTSRRRRAHAAVALGIGGASRAPVRRVGSRLAHDPARFRLPLSLAGALGGGVPHLVRPDAQGVRGAAARRSRGGSNEDLLALIAEFNISGDETAVVPRSISRS